MTRKEKALQKETRQGECRTLRSATKGAAFGNCELLKKLDQNFNRLRRKLKV